MRTGPKIRGIGRRCAGLVRRVVLTCGALVLYVRDELVEDLRDMVLHSRLFLGLTLVIVGVLSFASGTYCDGTTATHYTCTRPATYYYYPWWAVLSSIVGSVFIVLWFLRRKQL